MYLCYILHYNPIQCYLSYCQNFSSFGHWKLFQLAPVSLQHTPSPWVVFCFVLYLLTLWYYKMLCAVFIFPALDYYQPFLQELAFGRQEARDVDHKPLRHRGCPGCLGEFICSTEEGHTWSCSLFSLISQVHVALW